LTAFTTPDRWTLLATGGGDETVRIWDPGTRQIVAVVPVGLPVQAITAVENALALGTSEGVLLITLRPTAFR